MLEDLAKQGFLKKSGHSIYALNTESNALIGTLQITPRGAGFVVLDDPMYSDVFVHPKNLNQSLGGDRVTVQITKKGKSRNEGVILSVEERERTQFVGTIQEGDKFSFLVPDNSRVGTDIFLPKGKLKGAKNGDKALVRITAWPQSADNPYGEVIEDLR